MDNRPEWWTPEHEQAAIAGINGKTPAQAAYEAWSNDFPLAPQVLPWEQLPEAYASIWSRCADAAINRHIEICEEGSRFDPVEQPEVDLEIDLANRHQGFVTAMHESGIHTQCANSHTMCA